MAPCPVKSEILGKTSRRYEPAIFQLFIGKDPAITDPMEFERKLYIIRRRAAYAIRNNELPNGYTDVHGNKSSSFPEPPMSTCRISRPVPWSTKAC